MVEIGILKKIEKTFEILYDNVTVAKAVQRGWQFRWNNDKCCDDKYG